MGEISFRCDDYIPDFESFEEYLHSNQSDRISLDIEIIIHTHLYDGKKYKGKLQQLIDKDAPGVKLLWGKKDHGKLYAHISIGICLLHHDESDISFIYEKTVDLWKRTRLALDAANRLEIVDI